MNNDAHDVDIPGDEPVAAATTSGAAPAAGEQSGNYVYPDGGAASSQRLRLVPPDGKPAQWWQRHKEKLKLIEIILTGVFFVLALYFLFLWIFA